MFETLWDKGGKASKALASAGALFSRVQGIKLGPFFATFSRTFSGAAFGRSLGNLLVDFSVQVVSQGDQFGSLWADLF